MTHAATTTQSCLVVLWTVFSIVASDVSVDVIHEKKREQLPPQ